MQELKDMQVPFPGSGRSAEGGHSNPLPYSCLKSPMDRRAWQATVHGKAKSRTRLSDFHFWFSDKESAGKCRRHRRHGFDPWVGKMPWSKKWQPTLVLRELQDWNLESQKKREKNSETNSTIRIALEPRLFWKCQ